MNQIKKKQKLSFIVWTISNLISTTEDKICRSNAWLDLSFFLLYSVVVFCQCQMSFVISKNVEHSLEKTPRELMERFTNLIHL